MKSFLESIPYILGALLIVFPWLFGLLDIVWWFLNNHLSGIIEWSQEKVMFAIAWPVLFGMICAGMS